MHAKDFMQSLGIGLSRAIRYSFGGFLFIVAAYFVDSNAVSEFIDGVGWELTTLAAIVTGMGIYALHRSLVIPVHHFTGVLILNTGELTCQFSRALLKRNPYHWADRKTHSLSPTRWLNHLGVPKFRRMLAYAKLRRDFFDDEERNALDVVHAESGLSVMISEALLATSAYYYLCTPSCRAQVASLLLIAGLALFVLSALSGIQQHRVECARFKEEESRVREIVAQFTFRIEDSPRT